MPTPEHLAQLTTFYKEWRAALEQQEAAAASAQSWATEAVLKEARFKGAAELLFESADVSWAYNVATGELSFTRAEVASPDGEVVLDEVPVEAP